MSRERFLMHQAQLEARFAAGHWDAYVIAPVRLRARATGPHRLELRTTAGQVLWRLPLTVRDAGASGAAAASPGVPAEIGAAPGELEGDEEAFQDTDTPQTGEHGDDPAAL